MLSFESKDIDFTSNLWLGNHKLYAYIYDHYEFVLIKYIIEYVHVLVMFEILMQECKR